MVSRVAPLLIVAAVACSKGMQDTTDDRWAIERERMVDHQLRGRDIRSDAVLEAMRRVPRHRFVPAEEQGGSYSDYPLPIGFGQTISQPYIVAFMTEALEVGPDHTVLEIGTGSGYQAAVLGRAGARRLHDRDRRAAGRTLARPAARSSATATSTSAPATATWAGRTRPPSIASSSPPRPTRCRRPWSSN